MRKKYATWTTRLCLIGLLGLGSACVPTGGGLFCDVVRSPIEFAPETAAQLVRTDRAEAEQIASQNKYGEAHCPW